MGQEIDDAMGEHADKEGHRWFVEQSGQGEAGTDHHKRMHSNRYGMQHRVVQERMECLDTRRLRYDGSIVRHKAQRYEHIGQDATKDGKPLFVTWSLRI
jgi:hypothetical protein